MKPRLILQEEDFCLEFFTLNGSVSNDYNSWRDHLLADDGIYLLQEIIIAPPDTINRANEFSASTVAPLRCNKPLIFSGLPGLPLQYAATAVRADVRKSMVEKNDQAIKISARGVNLLYSAPIFGNSANRELGFNEAFHQISKTLNSFRMRESDIVRTWLFLRDILADYDKLNFSREEFFIKWLSTENNFLPASTGIQNRIIGNEILAFCFCAFSGDKVKIKQTPSPLQNEPSSYGKLFSRAVTVGFSGAKLLFISGTAAINKTGASVCEGDFQSQLVFTLEVIAAILHQEQCDFSNIVQAIVYLKGSEDLSSCLNILEKAGFPADRALFQSGVDICRDDLLCEIEVTAVAT